MADYSSEFGDAVRRAVGDRSYRKVAKGAGFSASYLSDMIQGRIPGREILIALVGVIQPDPDLRAELFRGSGYVDPAQTVGADHGVQPTRLDGNGGEWDGEKYALARLRALAQQYGEEYVIGHVKLSRFWERDAPKEEIDRDMQLIEQGIQERIASQKTKEPNQAQGVSGNKG